MVYRGYISLYRWIINTRMYDGDNASTSSYSYSVVGGRVIRSGYCVLFVSSWAGIATLTINDSLLNREEKKFDDDPNIFTSDE